MVSRREFGQSVFKFVLSLELYAKLLMKLSKNPPHFPSLELKSIFELDSENFMLKK